MDKKEEKFKTIVAENSGRILRICRYYAPAPEDSRDMYQETLVNIWRSLDTFRGDSKIETWIYRIAVNTSLSFAGKQYRQLRLNIDLDSPSVRNLVADNDDDVSKESMLNELEVRLNQLSVIDKAIMGLVLDELPMKDIADIIGITEPNVRVKIHRIK